MHQFLENLKQRYGNLLELGNLDAEQMREVQRRLNALRFALAIQQKVSLSEREPDHPLQIGILGPTQAGKSTLVNLLLQTKKAGVSPLAGYTVHAQGFAVGADSEGLQGISSMFDDFEQTPATSLDLDNYKQFSLATVDSASQKSLVATPSGSVVWDSPDFDSIESRGYRTAVLRVAALSDVIIMMLSKDKYADRSVWEMLELLAPTNKPMLICINKLNEEDQSTVVDSFWQRYRDASAKRSTTSRDQNRTAAAVRPLLVTLPYTRGLDDSASQFDDNTTQAVEEAMQTLIGQVERQSHQHGLVSMLNHHWDEWLQPVRAEQEASEAWQECVDRELAQGLITYRESYLEHPDKYDTFNKAIAELLTLLEIPGIAGPLQATRKLVTWPVRKLLGVGQAIIGDASELQAHDMNQEQQALNQVFSQLYTALANTTLDRSETDDNMRSWWLALNKALRQQQVSVESQFNQGVVGYQENFAPEIDKAAQALYKNLQGQPLVLNSLRAARVSTDAAAVVLAVKSGGLAASDLLLAPAMLSITSILTEGAVGKYMDKVRADFKTVQLQTVDEQVLNEVLAQALFDITAQMQDDSLFSISQAELAQAEAKFMTLTAGTNSPPFADGETHE